MLFCCTFLVCPSTSSCQIGADALRALIPVYSPHLLCEHGCRQHDYFLFGSPICQTYYLTTPSPLRTVYPFGCLKLLVSATAPAISIKPRADQCNWSANKNQLVDQRTLHRLLFSHLAYGGLLCPPPTLMISQQDGSFQWDGSQTYNPSSYPFNPSTVRVVSRCS